MISARQANNIILYMMGSSNFTAPTATFVAAPDNYTLSTIPGGITLSGTITANDATITGWSIMNGSTVLATGTGTSVSHNLAAIPSTEGSFTYNLVVNYTDNNNNALSLIVTDVVLVSQDAKVGGLNNPSTNITTSTDLTPALEATLTSTNQAGLINLFNVTTTSVGRLVFVIPNNYGAVQRIEDNTNSDVTAQFNAVADVANNRVIYVSINTFTAQTYQYKFVF